jgi:hypothetical protein
MKLKGNILIFTQWSYKDALIQTYTLPYVKIIRKILSPAYRIIIVTAEKSNMVLTEAEQKNLNEYWSLFNIRLFSLAYKRFGWKKFFIYGKHFLKLYSLIKREDIKIIHAFCMPAGSLAYLLCKLTGTALVMDSYEPHATAMVETGAWKKNDLSFKILFLLEKKLSQKAAHIIATTAGMKQYAKENYGVELKSFFVKPACIGFVEFFPRPKDEALMKELDLFQKTVCVYAGKLGGTYLKNVVFDFLKACYDFWGESFRFLMLTGESEKEINNQRTRVNLPTHVVIRKYVEHNEIPRWLSLGDFAINPQVPVPSKRFGTPIKNGEYWAMGLPVVISPGISDDSDIIAANGIGVVINLQQKQNHITAVKQMDELLKNNIREELQKKIFEVAKKYRSFEIACKIYPQIYEN